MKTRLINLMIQASVLAILIGLMSWGAGFAAKLNTSNKDRHQDIVETTIYTCLECHFSSGSSKTDSKTYSLTDAGSETEYHHVAYCTVCHDVTGPDCGGYTNLYLIACTISTPNSGNRNVKFTSYTGVNSYADGDNTYDGVCEVCHTLTSHHRNDGSDNTEHFDGSNCTVCHPHTSEFSPPYAQFHKTHTISDKGPKITCTDCHSETDYTIFADGKTLANTTVCDTCHSPNGAFNGVNDPVIGAKTNWVDGIYNADGVTLKSGKEKWCAGCHDDAPAYSKPEIIEHIVDNQDAIFVCNWGTSTSGGYNGDYRWHAAGSGSCTATWIPSLPAVGSYNVYAWWKASTNRATNAKYTIYYDGGSQTIEVNQKVNGGQWNLLGTYPFAVGTSGLVVLSNDANGYVIADAIKFESSDPGIYAPNVIGDNITYGFYITGHKINCLSCHDASKKHIDHKHRTYELDESNGNAVVNPYANSYRLQGTYSKPSEYLCYDCHNSVEILGQSSSDVSHTNFWNNDSDIKNSHRLHFVEQTGIQFDSDWDGIVDSSPDCIACHNVHGSPSKAMIRHGELISSYGTTDKVPSLNFAYLAAPEPPWATATWMPDLSAGNYNVYAWWKDSTNRATNAKYTIYYNGGSAEVTKNQQINGSQWNLLGTYNFAAGTSGYVELSNEGADGFVMADAIGWDTNGDGTPDIIIDNGDTGFDTVGDWTCTSGISGAYDSDHCYHAKPVPVPDPNLTLVDSVGGRVGMQGSGVAQNGVCWACHSSYSYERAPYLGPKVLMGRGEPDAVPYDGSGNSLITVFVSDPDGNVNTVEIDLTPIGGSANQAMNDDGSGYYSYQVTIPAGTAESSLTFTITASDISGNTGEGKAIINVVDPDSIYVDNQDAIFVCEWGTSPSGGYNGDYRWHAAGDGSCTATWIPDLPAVGSYNVYAWWKASTNRATNAKYTIYYDGGSQTIEVNQEINDSQWVYLGTYNFVAGTSGYVVLSDDADGYVIADAIKFELQP
jgi:hypothetical protein